MLGDFRFFASDSGSSPISQAVKKNEFMGLIPTLKEMGVSGEKILSHLVRTFGLPQTFLSEIGGKTPIPSQTQAQITEELTAEGEMPSPQNIQAVLPQGL